MCTSFVYRGSDVIVGMNFDNNGMPYSISTKDPKQFVVLVDGGRGKYPSFGVNSEGTFINNLMVDSNGKRLYKRPSNKVTHTSKLVADVLSGKIPADNISEYLDTIELVNTPDFSTHNMITDRAGNAWVAEPGRGIVFSPSDETRYFVMTNFSICDYRAHGELKGEGVDRYNAAAEILERNRDVDIDIAFTVLNGVKQTEGEWTTAFSMVYSQNEHTVYYCYNRDFGNISKYNFII